MDPGERTNRREILRGRAQHMFKLVPRFVEPPELEQRAPERDARGDVGRMPLQAGFTRGNRVLELPRPAVLFGEGRERDRRRIQLDPASQFLDAGVVGHWVWVPAANCRTAAVCDQLHGTAEPATTIWVAADVVERPRLSVTVSVTL